MTTTVPLTLTYSPRTRRHRGTCQLCGELIGEASAAGVLWGAAADHRCVDVPSPLVYSNGMSTTATDWTSKTTDELRSFYAANEATWQSDTATKALQRAALAACMAIRSELDNRGEPVR